MNNKLLFNTFLIAVTLSLAITVPSWAASDCDCYWAGYNKELNGASSATHARSMGCKPPPSTPYEAGARNAHFLQSPASKARYCGRGSSNNLNNSVSIPPINKKEKGMANFCYKLGRNALHSPRAIYEHDKIKCATADTPHSSTLLRNFIRGYNDENSNKNQDPPYKGISIYQF